ncbi:hypothetical protein BAE44_0001397 [Dichanthelium oligosanthes]|uniref:Uncharacterized protein n=1 Tax=Dichanthelium oligosanthes TaxID=888268 RepID=A0A1E5WJS3_9POAL|nr:hypothetical protein BAE44_0001397 [Dichanthelium oligosanthes]
MGGAGGFGCPRCAWRGCSSSPASSATSLTARPLSDCCSRRSPPSSQPPAPAPCHHPRQDSSLKISIRSWAAAAAANPARLAPFPALALHPHHHQAAPAPRDMSAMMGYGYHHLLLPPQQNPSAGDAYMQKRYREDLSREDDDRQDPRTAGGDPAAAPIRRNVGVAPNAAASSGGFWMLPVSGSSAAPYGSKFMDTLSGGGGGGTAAVQAPLQFMSWASYPSNAAADGGSGGGGMSGPNLGMLAVFNAYNRGGSEDQQQHQQPKGEQQHGGDSSGNDEEDGDDSADENHGNNRSQ